MTGRDYKGIPREKIPWFPIIDPDKCASCGSCMKYCDYHVFKIKKSTMIVVNPYNCIVGCTSCRSICDWGAITFPSHDELIKWTKELKI